MIIRIVALTVAIFMHMNEVSVRHAINAHLHDRFIAHADLHATVTSSAAMAMLTRLLALAAITCLLAHAILVVIIVRLAAGALGAQMLIQPNEPFLRALDLSLLVRFHSLLLFRVNIIYCRVSNVYFRRRQADHCNFFLSWRCIRR